jgi:hypothetical protein
MLYSVVFSRRYFRKAMRWYLQNTEGQLGPVFDFYVVLFGGGILLFLGVPFLLREWPLVLLLLIMLEGRGLCLRTIKVPAEQVHQFKVAAKRALEGQRGAKVEALLDEIDSLPPSPQDLRLPSAYWCILLRDRVNELR